MKKIGIVTIFDINNFGSSLQAFALQESIKNLGFDVSIIKQKENSKIGERLIKLSRKLKVLPKVLLNLKYYKNQVLIFKNSYLSSLGNEQINEFKKFNSEKLNVENISFFELRRKARKKETQCFVCGSDQIWSPLSIYVSPFAFLRFAPKSKRFAFAPSFGLDNIPDVNRREFKKYIRNIPNISVREVQGQKIIYDLVKKDVPMVCDPTLLFSKNEWLQQIGKNDNIIDTDFILVYFLENPNEFAIRLIKELQIKTGKKIIQVYRKYDSIKSENIEFLSVNPFDFIHLINQSYCVITDSYHGMLFSINFNKLFWVFERNYNSEKQSQSSRIISILTRLQLISRFVINNGELNKNAIELNFDSTNVIIEDFRMNSLKYLEKMKVQ